MSDEELAEKASAESSKIKALKYEFFEYHDKSIRQQRLDFERQLGYRRQRQHDISADSYR